MKRLATLGFLLAFVVVVQTSPAQDKKKLDELKKGLQALNDFVGQWNGDGKAAPAKPKAQWAEALEWGWRFKGDDVWMTWKLKDGKLFKSGELRYVPEKQAFQLTTLDAKDQKQVYEGKVEKDILTLDSVDPTTKDTHRLKVNVAGDGVRLNMAVQKKPSGKTLFSPEYQIAYSMEGASLGARDKKAECIVSGGTGSGTVSYKGVSYPICCSGCRDAFNENPEYYVKLAASKKK